MSNDWKQWRDSPHWIMRETRLKDVYLTEFKRPEDFAPPDHRYCVYISNIPFNSHGRILKEELSITCPLTALAIVHHLKEKYGERSEDGGVRRAGAEA